ncbi:hypothetical protein [Sphingomonas sp. LaA6.9]|uniref:hypothetical protein n=1 Tax=Sphingomonas sp. LaA6.9 TaxID=2919914 RepID=UPI001F4F6218|nr:hypothetical protein [Sphingomonas sp. LaA6.9]MCJ8158419.1 hypothetical protein [Sphingomonas sp. LaA6.9]
MTVAHAIAYKEVLTRHIEVGGSRFVYRDIGPRAGVPVVLLRAPELPKVDLSGDFVEVMWFQGVTDFLQPGN